jgi:hypothetical protein
MSLVDFGLKRNTIHELLDHTSLLRRIFVPRKLHPDACRTLRYEAPILGTPSQQKRAADTAEYEAYQRFLELEDMLLIGALSSGKDRLRYKINRHHFDALLHGIPWARRIVANEHNVLAMERATGNAFDRVRKKELRRAGYRGSWCGTMVITTAKESPFELPLDEMYFVGEAPNVGHWHEESPKVEYTKDDELHFTHNTGAKLVKLPQLTVVTVTAGA